MGAKQSEQSNVSYYQLKAKTSETDPTPVIRLTEKVGGKWEVTKVFNSLDGRLAEIGWSNYDYEGETKCKCRMKFLDPDGTVNYLESNFNNLLYAILNSIAGMKEPGLINIDVWLGKAKEGSDKRYASSAVKNDGEKAGWLYEFAALPKPKKIQAGNKSVMDDSEVIAFWQKEIEAINARLKEKPTETGGKTIYADDIPNPEMPQLSDAPPVEASQGPDQNDDLPF